MKERIKKFLNEPFTLEYKTGRQYLLFNILPDCLFIAAVVLYFS